MKSLRTTPSKKRLLVILPVIAIVGLLAYGAAAYANTMWPFNTGANSTSTEIESTPATTPAVKGGTSSSDAEGNATSESSSSKDDSASTPQSNATLTITAANQNSGTLQIRTLISELWQDGTCTLALTRTGQQNVTQTSEIQALADSSTCQGFDVATSSLSTGEWNISITVTHDQQSLTASQAVTVE